MADSPHPPTAAAPAGAVPQHELILGGCKSGKSRQAEQRAAAWLRGAPGRSALLLATAQAGDAEMAARIARHQADRASRLPQLAVCELPDPDALAAAISRHSTPLQLLLVDCLTLWLVQRLMPLQRPPDDDTALAAAQQSLLQALRQARGPVVLVSNEIGLGVLPLGPEVRRYADALGLLHQQLAGLCGRVTLMVAGCALAVQGGPAP